MPLAAHGRAAARALARGLDSEMKYIVSSSWYLVSIELSVQTPGIKMACRRGHGKYFLSIVPSIMKSIVARAASVGRARVLQYFDLRRRGVARYAYVARNRKPNQPMRCREIITTWNGEGGVMRAPREQLQPSNSSPPIYMCERSGRHLSV